MYRRKYFQRTHVQHQATVNTFFLCPRAHVVRVNWLAAPGAMVRRCVACGERARGADKSCKNPACASFRPSQRGHHWLPKRIINANETLGTATKNLGAFIGGSFAFSLQHRHDIRVGIASGMYLEPFFSDVTKRMELLAVLYPCYWRWSTKLMLQPIVADLDQYLSVDAPGRSKIIFKALQSMTRVMADYQVVGFRKERRLELMLRTDAQILNAKANDAFRYHPFQNPVKHRRTAALEVGMLLEDVRTGNLLRACEELAVAWRTTPTYSESVRILQRHDIKFCSSKKREYGRTRLPALA